MYFSPKQKSEFTALKGKFLSRIGANDEAERAFSHATQLEMNHHEAWTSWGQFYDKLFREKPTDVVMACRVVDCYIQAAKLLPPSRARKLISRILWLLSCDSSDGKISSNLGNYLIKNELVLPQWLPFVPQMIQALSYPEMDVICNVLLRIGQTQPQVALFLLSIL